jgi:cytochrome b pre-mRNA-processing protein 3
LAAQQRPPGRGRHRRRLKGLTILLGLGQLFRTRPEKTAGRRLYAAAVAQARQPAFYADCGVPDTPTGRFDLIVLHGFLLMQRLKAAPDGRPLAQAFCDAVVEDIDRNLREMGTGDLSVGKKVKKLMQGFYGRLAAYETALQGGDPMLISALRRNLYGAGAADDAQLAAVARYVRREAARLQDRTVGQLDAGDPGFGPAPTDAAKEG